MPQPKREAGVALSPLRQVPMEEPREFREGTGLIRNWKPPSPARSRTKTKAAVAASAFPVETSARRGLRKSSLRHQTPSPKEAEVTGGLERPPRKIRSSMKRAEGRAEPKSWECRPCSRQLPSRSEPLRIRTEAGSAQREASPHRPLRPAAFPELPSCHPHWTQEEA